MIQNLIFKDLKRFLRDRSALLVIFLMPIIITTILGIALQSMFSLGETEKIDPIHFAIVDQDQSPYPFKSFMADLSAHPIGSGMLSEMKPEDLLKNYENVNPRTIFYKTFLDSKDIKEIATYEVVSEEKANTLLENNEIAGIVTLPSTYSKDMTMNLLTPFRNPVNLQVITNDEQMVNSMILKALIGGFVQNVDSVIAKKNVSIEQSIQYDMDLDLSQMVENSGQDYEKSFDLRTTMVEATKPINSKAYSAVGLLAMFLLFTAAMGGTLIIEEKDLFTYNRHLMAGVHPFGILLGKMSVIAAVATLQISVLIGYATLVFGVDWGSFTNILLISLCVIFAISGLGSLLALIGSITKSYKVAKIFENGLIQVLALFGGSYIPVEQMPAIIQTISHYVLNGVILKAYLFNMMGYSLEQLTPYLINLLINGFVFMALTVILFFAKEAKSDVAYHQTQTVDPA